MSQHRRYALAPHVVFTPTGDEGLLLKLDDETMFALNATGARTLQLAIEGLDEHALLHKLATEYETSPDAIEVEAVALLSKLVAAGLMRLVSEEAEGER
jgi:hypothetical protein